jgi:predicted extracellular nuclease
VTITFPLVPGADLEPYEGMLVALPQELVISEYFNYDRYGEVVVALPADGHDRPMIPTAVYDEDSPEAYALADLNERSRITIDDGFSWQNPWTPVHPINRELFSLTNAFRGGDTVSGLTGPLHFADGRYRVIPLPSDAGFATYQPTDAPTEPQPVGGDLRVASLNALNYFVTLDDGSDSGCGPDLSMECRGADADQPDEFARQRVKLINTLLGLDADVIGLNEVENSAGVEAFADLVAGLNDAVGDGTYDYVVAGTDGVVGTDAIKVGLLYKTTSVAPFGDAAVLDTPEFLDPNNTGSPKNRAAVAQTFVEVGSGEVFSVVVNHLKSKGSGCGAGDDHPLAGSCNVTRTLAAEMLADWIDTDPTGTADDDWLIIGDLNSYDQEDPIDALRDAGYTDLIGEYQGPLAYSYVFDGEFGYLDYIMSSGSMTGQVTGATEWHINADEPDIFDYDTSFKSDYQDTLFDPTTPYRSSDHDAALVGLSLDSGFDATVAADPSMIWPPNHKLRAIELVPADPAATVTVLSATSSEADSGLGDDDVPNDIVITDGMLELRAERYSLDGRTYTVYVTVAKDGQVVLTDATVVVDHDQRDRPLRVS